VSPVKYELRFYIPEDGILHNLLKITTCWSCNIGSDVQGVSAIIKVILWQGLPRLLHVYELLCEGRNNSCYCSLLQLWGGSVRPAWSDRCQAVTDDRVHAETRLQTRVRKHRVQNLRSPSGCHADRHISSVSALNLPDFLTGNKSCALSNCKTHDRTEMITVS
jgi:hypothetical protein